MSSVTLVNLIEDIASPAFPIALARMTAFALLEREPGEPDVQTYRLRAEQNGQILMDQPAQVQFQNLPRTRIVGEMHGFPLNGPGDLKFTLSFGDIPDEAAAWVVKVTQIGAPHMNIVGAAPVPEPGPPA